MFNVSKILHEELNFHEKPKTTMAETLQIIEQVKAAHPKREVYMNSYRYAIVSVERVDQMTLDDYPRWSA